jgi:hypothetical protein
MLNYNAKHVVFVFFKDVHYLREPTHLRLQYIMAHLKPTIHDLYTRERSSRLCIIELNVRLHLRP